jgi:hypothetical protein
MFHRMIRQKPGRQSTAVGESEKSIERTVFSYGLIQEIVCFVNGGLVLVDAARPFVVAVERTLVESFDPWTGRSVDFAFEEVEGGGVVFVELADERAELGVEDLRGEGK